MNLSLRQLRYFLALAETGHFTRAAEEVHVSQPALSVQIKEMEAVLGAPLIDRSGRGARLTPLGHDIAAHARRVLQEMTALEQTARTARGLSGRLALGVIPTVAPYLLPAAVPLLRAENLHLDLRVREALTDRLLEELSAGRLDAVVIARPAEDEDLSLSPLFTERFLLAGSHGQISTMAATGQIPDPGKLDPERLLLLDEGHCLADQALAACALNRSQTRVDLGASSLSTLSGLVAAGFGFTFLPEIALRRERLGVPGLSVARFRQPEPVREIVLAKRRSLPHQDWFEDLARHLRAAGQGLLCTARQSA